MDTEDRWYVRFRGHTLGPLTTEQVKSSVRRKELGPEDKLASTSNPSWRALRTEGEFLRYWEALTRPVPTELTPLPSPKILWQKKRAPIPAVPAAQAAAALEPVPETAPPAQQKSAAQTKPAPAPVKAKTKAKAKPAKKNKPAKHAVKAKAKLVKPSQPSISPPAAELTLQSAAPQAPESPPALANIPEKPEIKMAAAPAAEPSSAEASVMVASPSPAVPAPAPAPKLAEETLSLLEALREWNRKEKETLAAAQPLPEPQARLAPKPNPTVASAEPAPLAFARPEFIDPVSAPAEKRGIELRLNLVISKQFIFIFGLVAALALAAIIVTLIEAKKMRGPADSRLPDPSSPTIEPSPKDDPIPQLKAPTRPSRD